MTRSEKLSYIFETGKRLRFYMDHVVMSDRETRPPLCDELSGIQIKTAVQVSLHEPISLTELADKLGVSPPSASVMVDRLVDKQVLQRQSDPADRRRVQLTVHPEAREDMQQLHARFQQAFEHIARRVGNANLDKWFEVMQQVDDLLREESA